MKHRAYRKIIGLMICLTMIFGLVSCSRISSIFSGEPENEVTTDFLEDTVFTVGTARVSYDEWFLYMQPAIEKTEAMYGTGIWTYKVGEDGMTYAEALKEDVRDTISYIKIICQKADELGVVLSEDDMVDINIQTEDYLSQLSTAIKKEHGITKELVEQIYADNKLAMKVYENLTLNVDTTIPEEEVRCMVLEYIVILKSSKDANGTETPYTSEELAAVKAEAMEYLSQVRQAEDISCLSDAGDGAYIVTELVADKATLTEKLSEEMADAAFNMKKGEISELLETDEAYFIFNCIEEADEEATSAAKIRIIEERQRNLFDSNYSQWKNDAIVKINYTVWDSINIE